MQVVTKKGTVSLSTCLPIFSHFSPFPCHHHAREDGRESNSCQTLLWCQLKAGEECACLQERGAEDNALEGTKFSYNQGFHMHQHSQAV